MYICFRKLIFISLMMIHKGLNNFIFSETPTLDSSEYVIGKSSYFSGSGDHSFVLDDNSDICTMLFIKNQLQSHFGVNQLD